MLYIKQSSLSAVPYYPNGNFTPPGTCVCADGFNLVGATSASQCDTECKTQGHGSLQSISCVNGGLDNIRDPKFLLKATNDGKCFCADGTKVAPFLAGVPLIPVADTCEQVCNDDPTVAPQYAADNLNHCGWDFLYVKLKARNDGPCIFPLICPADITGNWDGGAKKMVFVPDNAKNSQLYDFFLSNNGKLGDSEIRDTVQNYIVGPDTFECAIIATNVDDQSWGTGSDETTQYWVQEGSVVSSKGTSLYWDIVGFPDKLGKYDDCAIPVPLPPPLFFSFASLGNNECEIDLWAERDGDAPLPLYGWGLVFYAKYSESYTDKCGNCTFAESSAEGHVFRPAFDIMCENGKWRRQ